jgi:dipeptidase E
VRLFLSSKNLGNYPETFLHLVGGDHRLVTIHSAIDDWAAEDKEAKVQAHLEQLTEQGFQPEDIDLRQYFGDPAGLETKLASFDGIFIFGGNTFILRRALAYSGGDQIIVRKVENDELAYGGSSAGSIVVTPSLDGSQYGDAPVLVPEGYQEEVIWDGLNLVPFHIVPHYKSDWFGAEAEACRDHMRKKGYPFKALRDGQVVLVDGDKTEVLK